MSSNNNQPLSDIERINFRSQFPACFAIFALAATAWACLVFLAPVTVGWRDSGEFLISPFLLDVVHPAGFPTYSQLANLLTLLPYGPIGWRVHLFAGLCSLLFVASSLLCLVEMMQALKFNSRSGKITGLIVCALTLLHSSLFWKGTLSAEVYLLNGSFVILCLAGLIRYSVARDSRILLTMAFGGGLACGNHIAFGFIALFSLPALLAWKVPLRTIISALVLGIAGLCVYGYLPARATATPPLNTGAVTSVDRFVKQVTNSRDALLRPVGTGGEARISQGTLNILSKDLGKLFVEMPPAALLFIVTGAILLVCKAPTVLLALTGAALGTLLFFAGWDGDPWMPVISVAGILAGLGSSIILAVASKKTFSLIVLFTLVGSMLFSPRWTSLPEKIRLGSIYEMPSQSGRAILDSVPRDRLLVTEPSWFILRFLTIIEGYRDDVILAYQPQVVFAGLFAPFQINTPAGETFTSRFDPEKLGDPETKSAARMIDLASRSGPVFIEPTVQLVDLFRALLQLRTGTLPTLVRGEPGVTTPEYFEDRRKFFQLLASSVDSGGALFSRDAQNYLEVLLGLEVNLLDPDQALGLYESVCGKSGHCSSRTLNNFGLTAMNGGHPCRAVEVLTKAAQNAPVMIAGTIGQNLKLAKTKCDSVIR